MNYLVSRSAFFKFGFVNSITTIIVGQILSIVIKHTEAAAFFFYIDMRVGNQGKEFEKAAIANQIAQQSGSEDEKKIAEENLIKAFKAFVKLTN